MKYIIASDIHGNSEYTQKLIKFINIKNPDKIILLGDLLSGYSCDRYEVANLLNRYTDKIISVRGNCDREEDNELLFFNNESNYKILEVDNHRLVITHGHLLNQLDFISEDDIVLYGHSHSYTLTTNFINPGSVGLPRNHTEHTCLIYENKKIKLIDLDTYEVIQEKQLF